MSEWQPITLTELESLISAQLSDCSSKLKVFFETIRVSPQASSIHRFGKLETVFVIAKAGRLVIYYEDVEEGFEVVESNASEEIPYQGCNQYELKHALNQLLKQLNAI